MGKRTFGALRKIANNMCEGESIFIIHDADNEALNIISTKDGVDLASTFAAILSVSLQGKGGKGFDFVAEAITTAVEAVIKHDEDGAAKLLRRINKSLLARVMYDMEVKDDCSTCPNVHTCTEPQAVKFRKKHGMPKPKKGKENNTTAS